MSCPPVAHRPVGPRTLASIERALVHVPTRLDEAIEGRVPSLPALRREASGFAVTSLAEARRDMLVASAAPMIGFVRRRYTRFHTDLTVGFETWRERMPPRERVRIQRDAGRVAIVSRGAVDVRTYARPDELRDFHEVARAVARRNYRAIRLPEDEVARARGVRLAAADNVRAWTIHIAGEPAGYLYCAARGMTLVQEHAGYDPAFDDLDPAGVLTMAALADLFAEGRFRRFDFGEGESAHKRRFATGGVPCVDMLLLRPSLANRLTAAALAMLDRAAMAGRRVARTPSLRTLAKRVRGTA